MSSLTAVVSSLRTLLVRFICYRGESWSCHVPGTVCASRWQTLSHYVIAQLSPTLSYPISSSPSPSPSVEYSAMRPTQSTEHPIRQSRTRPRQAIAPALVDSASLSLQSFHDISRLEHSIYDCALAKDVGASFAGFAFSVILRWSQSWFGMVMSKQKRDVAGL